MKANFAFTPPNGYRDSTYALTDPIDEASFRQSFQGLLDQLMNYVNALKAKDIPNDAITGLTSLYIQDALAELKGIDDTNRAYLLVQIAATALGQIPDGSLGDVKLSNTAGQIKSTVASHVAEIVSQNIFVTRDTSVAGIQTVTGLIAGKIPKRILVNWFVNDAITLKYGSGSWEQNGNSQSCISIYKASAAVVSGGNTSAAISAAKDESNSAAGTIQNVTATQFEINWAKTGLPTGTIGINIVCIYH